MPDLDLVEALPDDNVARMGALYFLTAYFFPRDYKKVVDNYLFALIIICDLEPSEIEMAMPYMNNIQYQKPIQPDLLSESSRKKRTKKSARNAYDDLRMQIYKLQSDNKLLNREFADIKSQMSCFNDVHSTKMNSIIQMQGVLKTDLMEIRTDMQFLSETVSAMISSSMEEIMRRFSEKAKDRGIEVHGVGDKGTHIGRGSDKTDEVLT
ncbi:Hypothetical predicted protein [Olea europaea subsp. europaea]|uniref:Uncharacterized protein n=1 Tax=Olea europaea subsp. europaea TaxID=158383 RepID=A0A8S0SV36_OLEEU|nr:Hypothetical predicted protein [Olea europaea subsp. europaea]